MKDDTRRSIADLIARHELEPELKDVYVEGVFDKEIIDQIITKNNLSSRIVYEIDTIDVPPSLLISHDLTEGNKQRVITLARELGVIEAECAYRCLVDRDLDHWFGPLESTPRLRWTDTTSIETYYLTEDFFREIFITLSKCKISSWEGFCGSFIDTLRQIYCLRLTDKELSLGLSWIDFSKSLKIKDGLIDFDRDGYTNKILAKKSKLKIKAGFDQAFYRWFAKTKGDPKICIRGHDFVFLISWAIGEYKGVTSYRSEIAIERILVLLANQAVDVMKVLQ